MSGAAASSTSDDSMMEEDDISVAQHDAIINSNEAPLSSSAAVASTSTDAPAYTRLLKHTVWDAHPRSDSFGCLLVSHIDPSSPLDITNLTLTPLNQLRFLLVQRRSTGAFNNLMVEIQEPRDSPHFKEYWWFQREARRCTDAELDAMNGPFDSLWPTSRVSVSWKCFFADCNGQTARRNYPMLQGICDRIRAERHMQGRVEPNDDENLSKLNYLVPKGQLQTASSIQRTPHMTLELDTSDQAGAIREVVEETGIPASDFILAPTSHPPLTHSQYPPRKVDIFIAFLLPTSTVHPSIQKEWILPEQAETRKCKWFSLEEIITYFDEARVYPQSYTHHIIFLAIQRYGWMESVKEWQAKLKKEKEEKMSMTPAAADDSTKKQQLQFPQKQQQKQQQLHRNKPYSQNQQPYQQYPQQYHHHQQQQPPQHYPYHPVSQPYQHHQHQGYPYHQPHHQQYPTMYYQQQQQQQPHAQQYYSAQHYPPQQQPILQLPLPPASSAAHQIRIITQPIPLAQSSGGTATASAAPNNAHLRSPQQQPSQPKKQKLSKKAKKRLAEAQQQQQQAQLEPSSSSLVASSSSPPLIAATPTTLYLPPPSPQLPPVNTPSIDRIVHGKTTKKE